MEQIQEQVQPIEAQKESFAVGDILHTSYGYDMTINNYCKIIKISPTRKTVICRMVKASVQGDDGRGAGTATATSEEVGNEFRLWVRYYKDNGGLRFAGKYPFCADCGDNEAKIEGWFHKWNNKPNYENTWD